MYIVKRQFKNNTAAKDSAVFKQWENRELTTKMAAKLLAKNNEWSELPPSEFEDIANSLGYYQEVRSDLDGLLK